MDIIITNYFASVTIGSPTLQTSISNLEIIAPNTAVLNFAFMNDQACTISVNGCDNLYLREYQGIFIDVVRNFKIIENGITFNWVGMKN